MTTFEGRVAVVTGGASGIGLAIAHAFARRGCRVMLLDVEAVALEAALRDLRDQGSNADVRGRVCDVSQREAVAEAARETMDVFGRIDFVFANAGVGGIRAPLESISDHDWQWVLGVNVMGMIHTVDAFLPLIREGGYGGRIVYTASIAGLLSPSRMGAYAASKFATVAMAESLDAQLAGSDIGVSVLCPAFVATRIHESARNRPADSAAGPATFVEAGARELVEAGIAAGTVGERVAEAVAAGEFYIFTHPEMRAPVEARFARIRAGFDAADRSSALHLRDLA
jgi:NAD(P)-dependent dehydrogenase (short-subunit alcohol dehydrogenase family)